MAIELRVNESDYELLIDGVVVHMQKHNHEETPRFVDIERPSPNVLGELFSYSISQLPSNLNIDTFDGEPNGEWIFLSQEQVQPNAYYMFNLPLEDWTYPISPRKFNEKLNTSSISKFNGTISGEIDDNHIYLTAGILLTDKKSIQEHVDDVMTEAKRIVSETIEKLTRDAAHEHIIRAFKFPPEYKNICSQYLIWFGEFLENFGINALISVNHNGEETRVVLSSEHTEQMFHKIEALFSQYIALPYAELLPATQPLEPQQQFMVTQLQSQIAIFKSQLEAKKLFCSAKRSNYSAKRSNYSMFAARP